MNIKELEEKRNELQTQMENILNKAKAEERAVNEEETAEFDKLEKEINNISNTIKMDEKVRSMDKKELKPDGNSTQEQIEERAFENYIRGVVNERTATNLTAGDNGAVIPTSIVNKIMTKVYDICPILEKSTKYNVTGKIELPYYDEDTTAITVAYATEFTALTSSVGKFTKIEMSGYLAGALSLISVSLINNSKFDIVNFVINEMSKAIARFCEKELLKGTSGKVAGLSGVTKKVTSASATAITSDELIDLKDSIKDLYQNNAIFIMSSKTRTALRKLKDGENRYLLNDDITSPFGTTLLGKPVYVSDNMDDMASGKDAIYYGDMSCLATKFSENPNIQVLREAFATMHAVGVVAWLEFDAKVTDTQGIAKLTMKTSV